MSRGKNGHEAKKPPSATSKKDAQPPSPHKRKEVGSDGRWGRSG
jgi:hypothetical protein